MTHRSFFGNSRTVITSLLTNLDSADAICLASAKAAADGADAVAVQLDFLPPEQRTKENYRRIMASAPELPFMFIDYRSDKYFGQDDEARQKFLLETAECGAEIVDVMGDLYDPSPRELTCRAEAIARQKELIREIHARGAKVVMSSHMREFLTADEVEAHLIAQKERGADLLKIVTLTDTEEHLCEAIRTDIRLSRTLGAPFIHLSNGKFSRLHRFLGLKLGLAVTFAVPVETETSQPLIGQFKAVEENIRWHLPGE